MTHTELTPWLPTHLRDIKRTSTSSLDSGSSIVEAQVLLCIVEAQVLVTLVESQVLVTLVESQVLVTLVGAQVLDILVGTVSLNHLHPHQLRGIPEKSVWIKSQNMLNCYHHLSSI